MHLFLLLCLSAGGLSSLVDGLNSKKYINSVSLFSKSDYIYLFIALNKDRGGVAGVGRSPRVWLVKDLKMVLTALRPTCDIRSTARTGRLGVTKWTERSVMSCVCLPVTSNAQL